MKIFNSLEEIKDIEETVVALGNFDGVHRGHQQKDGEKCGSGWAEKRGIHLFQSYADAAEEHASGEEYPVCGRKSGNHRVPGDRLSV